MTATATTIKKLEALSANDYSMVLDLIDHLSMSVGGLSDENFFCRLGNI